MSITRRKNGRTYTEGAKGTMIRENYPELGQTTTLSWIGFGREKGGMFALKICDHVTDQTYRRASTESRGHGTMKFPELPGEVFDLS